ncbi:MAG: carboxypeptidase-like regulatory domain-containing protein [Saprospiraceae bacterium]
MKIKLLILFILIANTSHSQFIFQGKILDGDAYQPIENASVRLENSTKGVAANKKGEFNITIKKIPTVLIISHVGFEEEKVLVNQIALTEQLIFLYSKTNTLNEITVVPKDQVESISKPEKYSTVDFEIRDNELYRLEFHGLFKKHTLSLTDLSGNIKSALKLKDLKQVSGLYQSCNNNIYVLTTGYAYAIEKDDAGLYINSSIQIDSFNRFVVPCKINNDGQLYYLNRRHNGLVSEISTYNLQTYEVKKLRTITERDKFRAYLNDFGMINSSQRIGTIHTNSYAENLRIRRFQFNGDFLLKVFYRPDFPIYISQKEKNILIFNHVEKRIETYHKGEFLREIESQYVLDKKWLEIVLIDQATEKIYGLFNHKNGISIKEINTETGSVKLVGIIDVAIYERNSIAIHNGTVYYLKEDVLNGSMKELLRYSI